MIFLQRDRDKTIESRKKTSDDSDVYHNLRIRSFLFYAGSMHCELTLQNEDECIIYATEKHSLSGGTASANFEKKITFQSGSSARAVPPGVSHFSSAWKEFLFNYEEISNAINMLAVTKIVGQLFKRSPFTQTPAGSASSEDPAGNDFLPRRLR